MKKLQSTLEHLASDFAVRVLGVLRTAPLDEIMSLDGRAVAAARGARGAAKVTGRRYRRSADELASMVEEVAGVLANHGSLRAEQIRTALGVEQKALPRVLKEGLDRGRFTKTGERRATVYTLKGAKRRGK